ncbi:MAG: HEAT repeat domain-containing protein [Myxococcota bacterium]
MSEDSDPPSKPPAAAPARSGTPVAAKLWSLTILANLAGFLVAVWCSRLVRGVPETEMTETLLRFAYYGTMLIVAFFDALLIDELLFGGSFRRTHLQGKDARYLAKKGADPDDLAVSLQRSTTSFPFLVLVMGGLTYLAFNVINDDFDPYYRRVGKHISAMAYGDSPRQIEAVTALSIRREPQVLPALRRGIAAGGVKGQWSAWALGRFADVPSRKPLYVSLVAGVRGEDDAVRREALVALGRLQHRSMADAIRDEIRVQMDAGEPVDRRLLYGLGAVQVMDSLPILEELLHGSDEQTQRMAAWALAQHRDQIGGREAVAILEQRLPSASPLVRCAIVHALGILADEKSNVALVDAYNRAPADQRALVCPRIRLSMRPDGQEDFEDLLMPQDSYAMKIIFTMGQMRATSPEIRAVVEPWLVELIGNVATTPGIREAARSLLSGIQEARDDSQRASVEQALGIE